MSPRRFAYQYRLVWRYKGEPRNRYYVSDNPAAVLRMLRRIGTDNPELGVTPTQLKRSWAWLARRLQVSFAAVADIPAAEILLRLRDSFPRLDYIRVEQRQVAPWVEMLDPLQAIPQLRPKAPVVEAKRAAFFKTVTAMSRKELDAWRWIPDEEAQRVRTRGDRG